MKNFQHAEVVEVRLWGRRVGALARDPGTGFYAFQYEPAWLKEGPSLAPLHAAFTPQPQVFTQLSPTTWHHLPAFIADALPDEFGTDIVTAWLSSKGVSRDAITPLDRLTYMGKRAMGALEFRPAIRLDQPKAAIIEARDLVHSAQLALSGSFADDDQGLAAIKQLLQVGTSAGGQRAKAIVAFNRETRQIRSGSADLPKGFAPCLLKLDGIAPTPKSGFREPGAPQGFGRIEYAYHLMAMAAGLQMARCDLLEENGRAHFITERFDRAADGEKWHTQTLCAMAHLDYKSIGVHQYDQLFETLRALEAPKEDFEQAYLRMVFNVAARNCDDHTKNSAFILRPEQPWRLAPAYDLTFAYSPQSQWVSRHLMGVNGKFDGPSDRITAADLYAVAARHGVDHAKAGLTQVVDAVARWPEFAAIAGVSAESIQEVEKHLRLDLKPRRHSPAKRQF